MPAAITCLWLIYVIKVLFFCEWVPQIIRAGPLEKLIELVNRAELAGVWSPHKLKILNKEIESLSPNPGLVKT